MAPSERQAGLFINHCPTRGREPHLHRSVPVSCKQTKKTESQPYVLSNAYKTPLAAAVHRLGGLFWG